MPGTRTPISALCAAPTTRLLRELSVKETIAVREVPENLTALLLRAGLARRDGDLLIAVPTHHRTRLLHDLVDAWLPDVLEGSPTDRKNP